MKYVALLSGGKDSCFNVLHCAKNGHELVAAASLGPGPEKEELDSYLYQTVGQDAIEFVARALDVPLFRRVITGCAVEQGSEYGSRRSGNPIAVEGDETEDLFTLLSEVKLRHPDIEGVSVGAILSNYQRVRVEHVCRRLGWIPLCYLWNRDQGELLDEMIRAQLEAVIIKVAGIGLTTHHLGKTLAQMRPTLVKLNDLYGAHICGEGGEYESLTLDCPIFKYRVILTEVETVIHSDNSFATVAFLRVKKAVLEPKQRVNSFYLPIPSLLDDEFSSIRQSIMEEPRPIDSISSHPIGKAMILSSSQDPFHAAIQSKRLGSWVCIANVQALAENSDADISLEDEVRECFRILEDRLAEHGLHISNCTNINMLLSSIDLFAAVNVIYATFFGSSPPARACVSVDLPQPIRVRLECIAFDENHPSDRQALHVQGLSYWAPANIGPYSQAIIAGEWIFVSGQIGLIPSQLALPSPPSLETEIVLASQHVARIAKVLPPISGPSWVAYSQAVLYWLVNVEHLSSIKKAHGSLESLQIPVLFLVVKELPKNALVEKQVLLHTGRYKVIDSDDDGSLQFEKPLYEQIHAGPPPDLVVHTKTARFKASIGKCNITCIKGQATHAGVFPKPLEHDLSIRLFYNTSRIMSCRSFCQTLFANERQPALTMIPCRFISTYEEDDWDYALCIMRL